MQERHYHVHYRDRANDNQEECAGDFAAYDTARMMIEQWSEADRPGMLFIDNLPYCLYGPGDDYHNGTYCVGRGERYTDAK